MIIIIFEYKEHSAFEFRRLRVIIIMWSHLGKGFTSGYYMGISYHLTRHVLIIYIKLADELFISNLQMCLTKYIFVSYLKHFMLWLHHYEGEPRHCQSKHEYLPTAHSRQIIIYWTFYQEKPPLPIHRRIYFSMRTIYFP